MQFVIIGGDAAGMSAASKAKRLDPEMRVVVLEQTRDVSYSACGMPYNIADPRRDIDDLVVRDAETFRRKQGIELLLGHRATAIDPKGRLVSGEDENGQRFEVSYDHLLIATGGRPAMPRIDGLDHPGVVTLKRLQDGRRIKQFIQERAVKRVVIIGMGYIALEMSEALVARGVAVAMVKPRPRLLPWMDEALVQTVVNELDRQGVAMHDGHQIEHIVSDGQSLQVVCADMRLAADMVLVAVGIKPNCELAAQAGLELGPGGAVAVDRTLRTSDARIYAAGDCADAFHVVSGERVWIPLALRANRAGWAVAENICGGNTRLDGVVGTTVFKVFDLEVARTGLTVIEATSAGFDPAEVVIKTRSKAHAHPGSETIQVQMVGDRRSGRLLGIIMVGRQGVAHRINAAAVALHAHFTVAQFSQCDLAYAPPFGPVWDPLLTAANQLLKRL
jgi:NADPH-dependent 2,4-dienoyl-CoA reductase/sulfur reductase-like enzyme